MNWNSVQLGGNLTKDVQTKFLPSQTSVAEFGIAVNRKWKTESGEQREEVTFVDCTAFGKTGENIAKFCTKGSPIFISGRLRYDSWEDKQGGGKRSKISIVVENFQFLPSANRGAGGGDADGVDQGDAVYGEDQTPMFGDRRGPQRTGLPDTKTVARRDPRAEAKARAMAPSSKPYSDSDEHFDPTEIPFFSEGRSAVPL